ncbi:MAG: hypothetical protein K2Y22_00665 [Candidatus Obscuribacterales bacterium]|nr:hypothetical protein [Candidatus Obscuribacterales bacterium]
MSRAGVTICCLAVSLFALSKEAKAQSLAPPPAAIPARTETNLIPGTVQADVVQQTLNAVEQASPDTMPIDLVPVQLPSRTNPMQYAKEGILFHLPARMFLTGTVENSLRLETNIFQTSSHYRQDMIYRILPNITMGYALSRKTRVSANYFFLRDQYAFHNSLMSRNIHSVGFEVDRDFQLTPKTTLTTGLFNRQLFMTGSQPFTDILPSVTLVRRVGQSTILYSSIMGQLRWRNMFTRWQEGDQFYTIGAIYRKNLWALSANTTLVSSFGVPSLRGGANNQVFISTFEIDRQLTRKLPIIAFVRAQPIFNIGANQSPGFAGVNFRVYGGLRMDISKPALFPPKVGKQYQLAKAGELN